jgi:hypothetical protein
MKQAWLVIADLGSRQGSFNKAKGTRVVLPAPGGALPARLHGDSPRRHAVRVKLHQSATNSYWLQSRAASITANCRMPTLV